MQRVGRMRARAAAVVLVMAGSIGLGVVAGASPAGAQGADHCGSSGTEWVPDRGSGFDFGEACRRHDFCYGMKPYGAGPAGRLGCDREFHGNMRATCAMTHGPVVGASPCLTLADLYYLGVRGGGGTPFEQAEEPTGTVEVGPLEVIRDEAPTGGGGGGGYGGGGFFFLGGGGGGSTPTGTVTVGQPETVETQAE